MDPADGRMHKKSKEAFLKEWTGVLVLLMPCEHFAKGNEKASILRRFWGFLHLSTFKKSRTMFW